MLRSTLRIILVLLACPAALGCGKKSDDGPTCEEMVAHMVKLTKEQFRDELKNAKPEEVDKRYGELEKSWVAECKEKKVSKEHMTCILESKTTEETDKCGTW